MINLLDTVASEYANSPVLMQLLENMQAYLDPTADLDNFYNQIWNVDTAVGYGLDVWGRIVGVSRYITLPLNGLDVVGFSNPDEDWDTMSQAPFWDGSPSSGTQFMLSDDSFRKIILVKALSNISDCSALAINQMLQKLFGSLGKCYVVDTGSMTMMLVFEFQLDQISLSILLQSGIIPRPAGVLAHILNGFDPLTTFGFLGSGLGQLGNSTFFSGSFSVIAI